MITLRRLAVTATLGCPFDLLHIENLEHPQGAVGLKMFVGAPSIGLIVVIDMHQQKGVTPLRCDHDGTPIIADSCASNLTVNRLLNLLKMDAALSTVLFELANELADPLLDLGRKTAEIGQHIPMQHERSHLRRSPRYGQADSPTNVCPSRGCRPARRRTSPCPPIPS